MARRFSRLTVVALAALAAACDQPAPSAPQADEPRFKPEPPAFAPCLFTGSPSLSNSANAFFTVNDDRKTASQHITAMQAAYTAIPKDVDALRENGFALLSLAGLASRQNTVSDPALGALMTTQDFNCMFDITPTTVGFEGWPDDPHYDFSSALTPATGGAFYVRGGDIVAPAIGNLASLNTLTNPAAGNISAIGTPSSEDTWGEVLGGQQVLFFGKKVANGYDWKVLPRNASFTPYAVVALCPGVNGGQVYDGADMVLQEGVGVLGFEEEVTGFCNTDPAPPFAAIYRSGSVFAALGRVFRSTGRWFSPEPVYAAVVTTSVIGGKVSGAKGDDFTFENVPTVKLTLTLADLLQPKNRLKVNSGRFSATVLVTTPAPDLDPVGGVTVRLSLTTNDGKPNNIFEILPSAPADYTGCGAPYVAPAEETTVVTVGANGESAVTQAKWNKNLCITKTGTVIVVAASLADENPDAAVANVNSNFRVSVIP